MANISKPIPDWVYHAAYKIGGGDNEALIIWDAAPDAESLALALEQARRSLVNMLEQREGRKPGYYKELFSKRPSARPVSICNIDKSIADYRSRFPLVAPDPVVDVVADVALD